MLFRRYVSFRVTLVVLLLVSLVSCTHSGPTGVVKEVSVHPAELELITGGSGSLRAEVVVVGDAETSVTWSSADVGVATVDPSGVVTAVAPGSTTITATSTLDNTKSGSATVTVLGTQGLLWDKPLATSGIDVAEAVVVDANGNIVVVGSTNGRLGDSSAGGYDAFVRKHSPDGGLYWVR